MGQGIRQRAGMAALGALAGVSLYLLAKIVDENWLGDRIALALVSFAVVFFAGGLSMAGPVRMVASLAGFPLMFWQASAVLWLCAFAIFLWFYWPVLTQPRADGRPG